MTVFLPLIKACFQCSCFYLPFLLQICKPKWQFWHHNVEHFFTLFWFSFFLFSIENFEKNYSQNLFCQDSQNWLFEKTTFAVATIGLWYLLRLACARLIFLNSVTQNVGSEKRSEAKNLNFLQFLAEFQKITPKHKNFMTCLCFAICLGFSLTIWYLYWECYQRYEFFNSCLLLLCPISFCRTLLAFSKTLCLQDESHDWSLIQVQTSTLSQHRGWASQPSIMRGVASPGGGVSQPGGVLHDNNSDMTT